MSFGVASPCRAAAGPPTFKGDVEEPALRHLDDDQPNGPSQVSAQSRACEPNNGPHRCRAARQRRLERRCVSAADGQVEGEVD
jgi:hypothetical protein